MEKLTSKDKEGKILVNGEFKICNTAENYIPVILLPLPRIHCKNNDFRGRL